MIKLRYMNGRLAPHFVCDHCHEIIVDAEMANEVAVLSARLNDGQLLDCYHVHKGACDRAMEAKLGQTCGWTQLDLHLLYLLHSAGVKAKDLPALRRQHDLLDSIVP